MSSHSSTSRRWRVLAGLITLALAALVGVALHSTVSHNQIPALAKEVSSYRAKASEVRLLVLGGISISWYRLAPWVARRTGMNLERVNAQGWRLLTWAATIEFCVGQDLLARLLG